MERQDAQSWGKSVVEGLARDLQEFSGMVGFSASNLWPMKLFYETCTRSERFAALVREIAWSPNIIITTEQSKNAPARDRRPVYPWDMEAIYLHMVETPWERVRECLSG